MTDTSLLINVAAQVPIVVIFVWFVLKLQDRADKVAAQRDTDWRLFLDKIEQRTVAALSDVSNNLKTVAECVSKNGLMIADHDNRVVHLAEDVEDYIKRK